MSAHHHVRPLHRSNAITTQVITGPAKRIKPAKHRRRDYDGRLDQEARPRGCQPIGSDETVAGIARRAQECMGTDDAIRVLRWWAKQPHGDARFAAAADRLAAGS